MLNCTWATGWNLEFDSFIFLFNAMILVWMQCLMATQTVFQTFWLCLETVTTVLFTCYFASCYEMKHVPSRLPSSCFSPSQLAQTEKNPKTFNNWTMALLMWKVQAMIKYIIVNNVNTISSVTLFSTGTFGGILGRFHLKGCVLLGT